MSPGRHRRAYFNNNIFKDHSVVLKMAEICRMNSKIRKCRDLKHKLAALQRSAEELFVCQYGSEQSMHLRCDVTYPHIANIF